MKVKSIYFVILLVITIGLNGCSKTQYYSIDEKKEMVLNYLEEKYEEEFEGFSYAPSEILKQHDEFWVYPKHGDKENELFIVTGSYSKKLRKYVMHDAYFGILIHDKYLEYVNDLVKKVVDEFYLTVDTKSDNPYVDRYNKDTEIKDIYIKNEIGGLWTNINIYAKHSSIKGRNVDDILLKITQLVRDNNLKSMITFVIVLDNKYEYFINNFNEIKINEKNRKEYYAFENNRKTPYYESDVYEDNNTNNLEIDILEEK